MSKRLSLLSNLNKKAITLLEVIIVLILISVVVGIGIAPYMIQQDLLKKQFARSRLQDEISVAMAYMFKDTFRAKNASLPSASQLVLTIDPSLVGADQTITYQLSGNNITRQVDAGSAQTIAADITNFSIASDGRNYINVSITGTKQGETISIETSMALRATPAV